MRIDRKLLGFAARVAVAAMISSSVARAQAGSGQPGVAALITAVNSADAEVKALRAEKSVTSHDVHVYNVAKIVNDGSRAVVEKAIAKNAGPIGEMREQIQKNQVIMAALAAASVTIGQVVAIDVQPGSEVHIFYQ